MSVVARRRLLAAIRISNLNATTDTDKTSDKSPTFELSELNPTSHLTQRDSSRDTGYLDIRASSSSASSALPLVSRSALNRQAIRHFVRPESTRRDLGEPNHPLEPEEWVDLQEFHHLDGLRDPALEKLDSSRRLPTEFDIMKFSHSLQFNAVPDWNTHYIAYSNLKKLIYTLEKQIGSTSNEQASANVESSPLLSSRIIDPDATFRRALDNELEKICAFYAAKEDELYEEVAEIKEEYHHYVNDTEHLGSQGDSLAKLRGPHSPSQARSTFLQEFHADRRRQSSGDIRNTTAGSDDDSDADANSIRILEESTGHTIDPRLSDLFNRGVMLKKRTIGIYVSLCELKSFTLLNKTGFSKALKKFDKTLDRSLKRNYMNLTVAKAYPFTEPTVSGLDAHLTEVERMYADFVTNGDQEAARRELRLHLREHVVWERNTVWREMIAIERKAQAAQMGGRRTLLAGDTDPASTQKLGDESEFSRKTIRFGRYSLSPWILTSTFLTLLFSVILFVIMLSVPLMEQPEQQNCLAILVFVCLLWATEVIPLFVTSLMIPFLITVFQVLRSDNAEQVRLPAKEAAKASLASMWTPVIMLLLGGFTIAAALSKYDIARRMATFVLSKAGMRPQTVLVTNMFVSMVLSMWISNVAAPVLCYSIIQPLLRNLPADSHFSKAVILGIALASNVGGAASPIASPQNIIALQNMDNPPSWGTWFFVALPVCIISVLLIWVLLISTFKVERGTTIVPIRPVKDRFTGVQWFVSVVTIVTIALWCISHNLEGIFGDMGIIAIVPLVLFFGSGILTKEDFNNFLWTIIILAAGGLCLGHAVTSSGLLHTMASTITQEMEGLSEYAVLVSFALLILCVATFISHTVAALILLPLVKQIGLAMNSGHANLLVMGSALMCSFAMGLPTSGFPNMTAVMMEVPETGLRYLRVRHFLTRGIPASFMAFGVVVTLGYGLMIIAGL
ncbi:ribosomal protein S8A [Ascosphaera pollenicola]|nr:ribosomal protein S8A [Ascosphaera pollenicola]